MIDRNALRRILTYTEKEYLEEKPFTTESCTKCSSFRWGNHEPAGFVVDWKYGEKPGCHNKRLGLTEELDLNPGAEPLTPEEALIWYNPESVDGICPGYEGFPVPTIKTIQNYIDKRNRAIRRAITRVSNKKY